MADYPYAVAILLGKRKEKSKNVLLGSNEIILKALERHFSITISPYDPADPKVFSFVERDNQVPIEEHASCTFWRNPALSKNSELIRYIISTLAPKDTKIGDVDRWVRAFLYDSETCRDFDALCWRIRLMLHSGKVHQWDKQPWESKKWVDLAHPDSRLTRLYADLRGYVFAKDDAKEALKMLGLSQNKVKYLQGLQLSNNQIEEALSVLYRFRSGAVDGTQAAFLISTIWSPYEASESE